MSQLALFAPEAPALQSPPAGRPTKYACLDALMACPVIEAELMQIFRARPAEWLGWPAFRSVIETHGAGFGLGHKLGAWRAADSSRTR
jgi:hypothetical protein